jgi:hypothetical protein
VAVRVPTNPKDDINRTVEKKNIKKPKRIEQSYSVLWRGTPDWREDNRRLLAATWISTEKSESASKELFFGKLWVS